MEHKSIAGCGPPSTFCFSFQVQPREEIGAKKTSGGDEQMAMWFPNRPFDLHRRLPCYPPSASMSTIAARVAVQLTKKNMGRPHLVSVSCSSLQRDQETRPQEEDQEEVLGIMCEPCNGRGWLLCDFCKGQKTNVKAENSRIYRRCPTCKAVGYVLCSKCKVFKCVTFPDYSDGDLSIT